LNIKKMRIMMIKMKVKKMEKKDGNKETTLTKKIKKD
jgi:hypothetical protein